MTYEIPVASGSFDNHRNVPSYSLEGYRIDVFLLHNIILALPPLLNAHFWSSPKNRREVIMHQLWGTFS